MSEDSKTDAKKNIGGTTGGSKMSGGSPSSGKRRRRKSNNKKKTSAGANTSNFKGTIEKMNSHVFQVHGEGSPQTQYDRTCEELCSYATIQYTNGADIQHLIKHSKKNWLIKKLDF